MPRRLKPYVPKPADLEWAAQMLRIVRTGGMIGTSVGSYRLDKDAKTITLTEPENPWNNPLLLAMHHRHHFVWQTLGYTLLPVVDWDAIELPDLPVADG